MLLQAALHGSASREHLEFHGMIGSRVESSIQRHAAGAHQDSAFIGGYKVFWHQEKVERCRHAHLNVEPGCIYPMRESDDRWISTVVSFQHHVAAITQRLRLQKFRNLKNVWLNGFIAQEYREPPHPINYDPDDAYNDSNIQDQCQGLHEFSGRLGQIILRPWDGIKQVSLYNSLSLTERGFHP